jgi:hypothetical protein
MIKRLFTSHPASVGETYGQHLVQALSFAAAMFAGAVACLIHALVPSMCKRTGSRIIMRLHDRMVVNRARPFP